MGSLPAIEPRCRGIGVLGMKSLGDHEILKRGTATAAECLYYAMNLPTNVVITGCDSLPILKQALAAARSFRPLTADERDGLLAKTAPVAGEGK